MKSDGSVFTLENEELLIMVERHGSQPSLILRRMAEGETLWDIARQYRTDEEAIRAANELTEDRPEGMLLIPRVR